MPTWLLLQAPQHASPHRRARQVGLRRDRLIGRVELPRPPVQDDRRSRHSSTRMPVWPIRPPCLAGDVAAAGRAHAPGGRSSSPIGGRCGSTAPKLPRAVGVHPVGSYDQAAPLQKKGKGVAFAAALCPVMANSPKMRMEFSRAEFSLSLDRRGRAAYARILDFSAVNSPSPVISGGGFSLCVATATWRGPCAGVACLGVARADLGRHHPGTKRGRRRSAQARRRKRLRALVDAHHGHHQPDIAIIPGSTEDGGRRRLARPRLPPLSAWRNTEGTISVARRADGDAHGHAVADLHSAGRHPKPARPASAKDEAAIGALGQMAAAGDAEQAVAGGRVGDAQASPPHPRWTHGFHAGRSPGRAAERA